jgi:hypothetical protein
MGSNKGMGRSRINQHFIFSTRYRDLTFYNSSGISIFPVKGDHSGLYWCIGSCGSNIGTLRMIPSSSGWPSSPKISSGCSLVTSNFWVTSPCYRVSSTIPWRSSWRLELLDWLLGLYRNVGLVALLSTMQTFH